MEWKQRNTINAVVPVSSLTQAQIDAMLIKKAIQKSSKGYMIGQIKY